MCRILCRAKKMNSKITLDVVQSNLVLEAFSKYINLMEVEIDNKEQDNLWDNYSDIIDIYKIIFILKELKEETMIEKDKKTFTFKMKFSQNIMWCLDNVARTENLEKNLMCEKIKQKIYKANAGSFY